MLQREILGMFRFFVISINTGKEMFRMNPSATLMRRKKKMDNKKVKKLWLQWEGSFILCMFHEFDE